MSLKELIKENKRHISNDIAFVSSNYGFLPDAIQQLESGKNSLAHSLKILDDAFDRVNKIDCEVGKIVRDKFKDSLGGNPDLSTIKAVNAILTRNADYSSIIDIDPRIKLENIEFYKMCLLVSVDTERSFSRYKSMLRDNRRSFLFENFLKYFFLNVNSDLA